MNPTRLLRQYEAVSSVKCCANCQALCYERRWVSAPTPPPPLTRTLNDPMADVFMLFHVDDVFVGNTTSNSMRSSGDR